MIESIDESLIPLVPPEDDVTKDVNVEIGVNLLPGQEKILLRLRANSLR